MTEQSKDQQPDDREPPELQDTAERSALPLPVPGSDEPAPIEDPEAETEAATAGEKDPVSDDQTGEPPADAAGEPPADKSAAVEEPAEADAGAERPSNGDAPTAAAAGGEPAGTPFSAPPFSDAAADEGVRPEILLGAAFLGGVALAFLIKRLGS